DSVRFAQEVFPLGIEIDNVLKSKGLPRAGFFEDRFIVRVSALRVEKKRAHAGFPQHKGQFVRAVGGVYVYQDNAGQRAAELKYRPFGAASRPHPHAVAGVQSKGPQARCNALRLVRILGPSQPDVLVAADESDSFGKSIGSFEES